MNQKIYTAALVIIGDEILSGRTQDKNTQWIAEKINEIGIQLKEVRVIPDDEDKIVGAVNALRACHDYVFTTGGIGPTHDDITAQSIAKAFDVDVVLHDQAYQALLNHYGDKAKITEPRKKMAMIPEGGELIPNPVSGAPGIHIGNVYIMAGVPKIMQSMLDFIVPTLKGGMPMLSRTVDADFPESAVAQKLGEIQARYDDVFIGSYPKYINGRHATSLVLRSMDKALLEEAAAEVEKIVLSLL